MIRKSLGKMDEQFRTNERRWRLEISSVSIWYIQMLIIDTIEIEL